MYLRRRKQVNDWRTPGSEITKKDTKNYPQNWTTIRFSLYLMDWLKKKEFEAIAFTLWALQDPDLLEGQNVCRYRFRDILFLCQLSPTRKNYYESRFEFLHSCVNERWPWKQGWTWCILDYTPIFNSFTIFWNILLR